MKSRPRTMPSLWGCDQRDLASTLRRPAAPSQSPVGIEQVKLALDMGSDPEVNDELDDLIIRATAMVETHSMRALMKQSWVLKIDRFPGEIELRRPPVDAESVVIKYVAGGNELTLDGEEYEVDAVGEPARIRPINCWPVTDCVMNAVTVEFDAGFDTPEDMLSGAEWGPFAQQAIIHAARSLYRGCEVSKAYWDCVSWLFWGGQVS